MVDKKEYRPAHEVVAALIVNDAVEGAVVADALYGKGDAKVPAESIPFIQEALKVAQKKLTESDLHVPAHQAQNALDGLSTQLADSERSK